MALAISVIIPAFNEEDSIGYVLDDLPQEKLSEIIVVINACTDNTAAVAKSHGARVVEEACRGYGSACLKGVSVVNSPDIVVFIDGDYSDYPEELEKLVEPIVAGKADFVLGSRMILPRSRAALLPQARVRQSVGYISHRVIF